MMSQPFGRNLSCPTSARPEDFMMMNNNNYLPGISRMNGNLPFNRTPGPDGIGICPQSVLPINPSSMQQPNFVPMQPNLVPMQPNLVPMQPNLVPMQPNLVPMQPNFVPQINVSNDTNVVDGYCVGDSVDNTDSLMADMCETNELPTVQRSITTVTPISHSWPSSLCNSTPAQTSSVSFTFTTPTQSYLYSPALTATTQNRFLCSRATPHNFAPGCNAQWKHAVPRKIPWRGQSVVTTNQGVSIFTGSQSSSVCSVTTSSNILGTSTYNSPLANHPVASCSEVMRRPKRRHTIDTVDETSPETKILLTEEKIANHMRELNINQFSPPNASDKIGCKELKSLSSMCSDFVGIGVDPRIHGKRKLQYSSGGNQTFGSENFQQKHSKCGCGVSQSTVCGHVKHGETQSVCQTQSDSAEFMRHSQRQWHDFQLLEEKLEMIDEDSDSEDKSCVQPKLTIREGINITPSPVIPQEIMEKIRNPCREVILWSPPDPTVKKSEDTNTTSCHGNSIVHPCMDMMDASISPSTEQICTEKIIADDTVMETDFVDDMLEL